MLDSLTGGLISDAVVVAVLGLVIKLWPGSIARLSTWLYSHVDPGQLPYGSTMNRHWQQTQEMSERIRETNEQLIEIRKDTIKNTLIGLMEQPGDQSTKVRYELSKLEALHASCWVMQEAESYLAQHHQKRQP
ncbi:hypothetical protein [Bifidobacterium apicola]|uniref:hypothetical protein n=1 Tax=Bifidobacterium apicola TaxID=3230739 RepID=UPI0036F40EF0